MGVEQCLNHLPALRRYAWLLTGDGSRADDLVQDTLERACIKWSLWQPGTALKSWLLTLMHNLYLNQRRDRRHDDGHADLDDVPEPMHEPLAFAGERLDMRRAFDRLSPAAREVLLLVTVEEYSYAETARILDVPIGTVMSRLHRAREQLRRLCTDASGPKAGPAGATAGPQVLERPVPLRVIKR